MGRIACYAWLGTGPIDSPKQRHRSPSYAKRQERRKAARVAAESSHGNQSAEKVLETQKTEEVVELPKDSIEDKKDDAGEASEVVFKCEICDFTSKKETGLNVHMTRKHGNIEQLDGNAASESDTGESEEDFAYSDEPCGGDYCMTVNCRICIEKAKLLYASLKKKSPWLK